MTVLLENASFPSFATAGRTALGLSCNLSNGSYYESESKVQIGGRTLSNFCILVAGISNLQ